MSYDAFLIVLSLIGILSAVFFILAIISDIILPWFVPRKQATYINKRI